jgi:predicted XRE-type DNA-binding protein
MKKFRLPLIVLILILSAVLIRGKIPHETFKSEIWKTANLNSEENMSLRWDMMNDLRNKHKLVGMTKNEIIKLLGVPEDTASSEFRYYLGYSKTGINTGTLIITFNDKNIVSKLRVWQG